MISKKFILISYAINFLLLWVLCLLFFSFYFDLPLLTVLLLPLLVISSPYSFIKSIFISWNLEHTKENYRIFISFMGLIISIVAISPIALLFLSLFRRPKKSLIIVTHISIILFWLICFVFGLVILVD